MCKHRYFTTKIIEIIDEYYSLNTGYIRRVRLQVKCKFCGKEKVIIITQEGYPKVDYPALPKIGEDL